MWRRKTGRFEKIHLIGTMEESVKGTVRSISSIFPVEEAQKAVKHVEDTIAHQRKELDCLRGFITDNTNLVNLVQRLPDELHHDIMVPFGKAAFFPGRLIHTNEFMVLLGEGYYAERTCKQTIEILKRRGNALESQVESLKAMMEDLKVKASFFNATASEAAEGLVEIMEDYNEESSLETVPKTGSQKQDSLGGSEADNIKGEVEDEEYARLMSRLEELEKEELANQGENEEDEDDEQTKPDYGQIQKHLDQNLSSSEEHQVWNPVQQSKEVSHGKSLSHEVIKSNSHQMFPKVKENVQAMPTSKNEVSTRSPEPEIDSLKAFTCSIVERTDNLQINSGERSTSSSQASGSQPTKPVSRFKMQRR